MKVKVHDFFVSIGCWGFLFCFLFPEEKAHLPNFYNFQWCFTSTVSTSWLCTSASIHSSVQTLPGCLRSMLYSRVLPQKWNFRNSSRLSRCTSVCWGILVRRRYRKCIRLSEIIMSEIIYVHIFHMCFPCDQLRAAPVVQNKMWCCILLPVWWTLEALYKSTI